MSRAIPILAALASAVVVAGCGGASAVHSVLTTTSSSQNSRADSSQATLAVAKANAICDRLNAEMVADKPARQTVPEIARVTPRHIEYETRSVRELERLTPPTATAAQWRLVISARRALAAELVKLERAAKAGNEVAIKALVVSKRRIHAGLAFAAVRAGLTGCAEVR